MCDLEFLSKVLTHQRGHAECPGLFVPVRFYCEHLSVVEGNIIEVADLNGVSVAIFQHTTDERKVAICSLELVVTKVQNDRSASSFGRV